MFRKKHYLSREEREAILVIRQQFIDATLHRIVVGEPDDFDANLVCLRGYAMVNAAFIKIMKPHMDKMLEASEKAWHAPMNFFGLHHLGGEFYSQNKAIKEAYKILLSTDMQDAMKTAFAKEPRIIGLEAKEAYRDTVTDNGHGELATHEKSYDYIIKFADNTQIILHNLDDEKQLAEAKKMFEVKMQELSPDRRLAHG